MMDLCRTPFFHTAGQKSGPKSGSVQKSGQKSALFAGPGQHCGKTKDDIAQHPECHDDAKADGAANRGPGLFGLAGALHGAAECGKVGHQPGNHQQIEGDQCPFEQGAEKSAARFAHGMAAARTVKRFFGNVLFAGWAGNGHDNVPFWWNLPHHKPGKRALSSAATVGV